MELSIKSRIKIALCHEFIEDVKTLPIEDIEQGYQEFKEVYVEVQKRLNIE